MDLQKVQKQVFQNKKDRGFNTTDVGKEIILLTEELGELARAFRDSKKDDMTDAVGDIMIYCLGLCEMMGVESTELIQNIVENNKTRTHRSQL